MSDLVYQASVYSRTVKYTNFKGKTTEIELTFALDPLQLMSVMAGFSPKKVKSGNPALKNQTAPITDEQQIKFVRDLAAKAAGFPSEDGDSWEPFEGFADHIAGKAFMTKLVSSDGDRREFTEKVILAPFEAFVGFASEDPTNSPKEIQEFKTMLEQMRNLFSESKAKDNESLEERRERLAAELAALADTPDES